MVNKNSIFKLILLFFIISIVFSVNVSAKPIQFAGSPEQNMTLISTNCDEGYDSCANGNYEVNYKSFADTDQTVKYSRDNSTLFFTPMNLAYRGVQSWEEYEELNNAQSLPPSSGVLKNIMYYVDLFYDGIDLRYSNNQYQLKEELIINSFDSLPEPSSWLCKEEECTIYLELHELITYDSGTQLWINNELYDGSSTITTDNPIEFKDEDGQLLYYIDTPTAYDSNGSEISFNYTLKYQNKKTYLYWQIPYQWLNDTSRVYPVNIDPNIFSSNAVESVDASAFDTTSFVIAYVDDTNDDVSTIVYNTNGSVITAEIDIDDAMGGGTNPNVVAVATVTPEKYCVVFIDDTDEDVIFYTVHKNGSILYGPITVDSEVGGSKAVGITRMTDNSIAISYGDDVSDQETIAVYYINGTAILSPQQHVSVSSHVVSSVSRLTDTTFVNTFSINGANLQAKVFDTSGNEILGATTYDTIENTVYHNADVIRLTDSSFLLGYIDTTDDDATVSVMTTSGTETLDSFDIDTDISPGFSAQSCGIATINNHSGILAYFDDNENDISYGIFDTNGTLLFGPTDVDTGAVDQGVAVIASDNDNPDALSLCSDTAIIIWASAQSWTAIHTNNNSGWDGSCNAVPTLTSTAFTSSDLVSDANAYLNTTYTDGDSENGTAYLKCYVNDENTFNSTTSNIISGSEISFVIGKGNFTDCNTLNCSIYANDGTENSETVWSPKKTIYGYVDITNFAVNDTSIGLNGEVNLNTTVSLSGTCNDLDSVWATLLYSNGTIINQSLSSSELTTTSSDLEGSTISKTGAYVEGSNTTIMDEDVESWTGNVVGTTCPTGCQFDYCDVGDGVIERSTYEYGAGLYSMRFDDHDADVGYMKEVFDASTYDQLHLSYYWTGYGVDASEYCRFDINDSTSITNLHEINSDNDKADSSPDDADYELFSTTITSSTYDFTGNVELYFHALVDGTSDICWYDDMLFIGETLENIDTESNGDFTNYSNIALSGTLLQLSNMTVKVEVDAYDNSASNSASNNPIDLEVQAYNGASFVSIGELSVSGAGNFSISTQEPSILSNWRNSANRDIKIRAVDVDANATASDELNYSNVWVSVDYGASLFETTWNDTSASGYYNITHIFANTTNPLLTTNLTTLFFQVVSGVSTYDRDLELDLTLSQELTSLSQLPRSIEESITTTDNTNRQSIFTRTSTSSLTMTDDVNILSEMFKTLSLDMSLVNVVNRIGLLSRTVVEELTFGDSVTLIKINLRDIILDFTILPITDITSILERQSDEDLTFTDSVNRLRVVPRLISLDFTIEDLVNRLFSGFRTNEEDLTLSEDITSESSLFRTFDDSLTLTPTLSRLFQGFRINEVDLTMTDEVTTNQVSLRSVVQDLVFAFDINSLFIGQRNLEDDLTMTDDTTSLSGMFRVNELDLTMTDDVSRQSLFSRVLEQAINFNLDQLSIKGILRTVTQLFQIDLELTTDSDLYILEITEPTTVSPIYTSGNESYTIKFNFTYDGNYISENISIMNITIGGLNCTALDNETYTSYTINETNSLNDSSTTKDITSDGIYYIELPKTANVTFASFQIQGIDQGTDSVNITADSRDGTVYTFNGVVEGVDSLFEGSAGEHADYSGGTTDVWMRFFTWYDLSSYYNRNITDGDLNIYLRTYYEKDNGEGSCYLAEVSDMGATLDESDWSLGVVTSYGTPPFVQSESAGYDTIDISSSLSSAKRNLTFRLKGSIEDRDTISSRWYFDTSEDTNKPYITLYYEEYPTNLAIDVTNDGDNEFAESSILTTTNTTVDLSTEINSFLSSCTADAGGKCQVPINLTADFWGKVVLNSINITYQDFYNDTRIVFIPYNEGDQWNISCTSPASLSGLQELSLSINYTSPETHRTATQSSSVQYSISYLRLITQSFSFTNTVNVFQELFRGNDQTINLNEDSIRKYAGIRGLEQILNFDLFTSRYRGIFRPNEINFGFELSTSILQEINRFLGLDIIIENEGGIDYTGFRTIIQDFSINAIVESFKVTFRSNDLDLTMTDGVSRFINYPRNLDQLLTFTDDIKNQYTLFRVLTEDFTISSLTDRLAVYLRGNEVSFTISDIVTRLTSFFYERSVDEGLLFTESTLTRFSGFRSPNVNFIFDLSSENLNKYYITITEEFSVSNSITRIGNYYRTFWDVITFIFDVDATYTPTNATSPSSSSGGSPTIIPEEEKTREMIEQERRIELIIHISVWSIAILLLILICIITDLTRDKKKGRFVQALIIVLSGLLLYAGGRVLLNIIVGSETLFGLHLIIVSIIAFFLLIIAVVLEINRLCV